MSFAEDYSFGLLKNEAEKLVFDELDNQLNGNEHGTEICHCKDCVMDMAAIALNTVRPLYRYSLLGTQYAAQAMNDQAYADSIQQAVTAAIEKVNANPSHD